MKARRGAVKRCQGAAHHPRAPTALSRSAVFALGLSCCVVLASPALVAAEVDDPFAYNLRFALSPLAFQAGVSQSWFGSAARVEYAPVHFVDVAVDGRVAWLNASHGSDLRAYQLRAGLAFHIIQSVQEQELYGTVYPADTAAIGTGTATYRPMELPINEVMRSGSATPYDRDTTLRGAMRTTHSLRVGASYAQLMERARPDTGSVTRNRLPMLHLGYAFCTYWNLPPELTGQRELGYRRFYGDVLLATPGLTHAEPDRTSDGTRLEFQALGLRVGMQGAMEGLVRALPSFGFAYDLELGLYPGRGGLEGYLFLAFGVALDASTHADMDAGAREGSAASP